MKITLIIILQILAFYGGMTADGLTDWLIRLACIVFIIDQIQKVTPPRAK